MEVGGQLDDDFTKSSDDDSTPLCQPCRNDGAHRIAEGYCQTFNEFLCTQCYKAHIILSVCRNHVMLDKSQMPTKSSQASRPARPSPCTIPCTDHPEKRIEFYCQIHNTVVCGVCSVLYHNKPCELKYILDMKNILKYKNSTDYQDIVRRLEALEQYINVSITDLSENGALTEEQINAVIEKFRAFRKEIEEYFRNREEELMKLARKMKQEDKKSLGEVLKDLQTIKIEVKESQTKLASLENSTSDLFVVSTQIQQRLTELERKFGKTMTKCKLPEYRFKRDKTVVHHLLSSNADLGKLERTYRTTQVQRNPSKSLSRVLSQDFRAATAKRLPNIDVETNDDETPWITGLLLVRPHTLLVVDINNNKVMAVDVQTNKITSQLRFKSEPWDITTLNGDQEAAVTLPDNKRIQIISTRYPLSSIRYIKVQGQCYGISSSRQNIIVSFTTPSNVQVMDLTGKVLTTIQTDTSVGELFQLPYYLTVTMEEVGEVISVTDNSTNIISKFTMDGKLITTFKHGQWRWLRGVIGVGNNQLLVCNNDGNTVDIVSRDGEVVTLLDNKKHGIVEPHCLCYCESEGKLYVGGHGDPLSVYKLSYN